MWTTQQFLDEAIRKVGGGVPEPAAFAAQNTAYAIFIVLEALLGGDAVLVDGCRLIIDEVTYDISAGIPASLIDNYGLLGECGGGGFDVELARHGADLMVGFSVVRWGDELTRLETDFGTACALLAGRDYYGRVEEAGGLPEELEEQVRGLFAGTGVVASAEAATAPAAPAPAAPTTVAAPAAPATATAEATETTDSETAFARRQFGRTRRTHGRRALTPIKSHRSTATTRRRH